MLNIASFTEEQLLQPAIWQAIKAEAKDIIDHLMAPEARKLADQLEIKIKNLPGLESRAPDFYGQLQKLIVFLKITALPCLDDETVLDLVRNHFLEAGQIGLDYNERMTGKMYSIPDLIWPDFAEQIAGALKQNNQNIGQQPIIIKGQTNPQAPSVKNWLFDYDQNFGPDKHSALEQSEYLSRSPNAKQLNADEKNHLQNLLKFYDNLKPIPLAAIEKGLRALGSTEVLTAKPAPISIFSAPAPTSIAPRPTPPITPPAPPVAPAPLPIRPAPVAPSPPPIPPTPAPPKPPIPAAPKFAGSPSQDSYREPVPETPKIPSPLPPASHKPSPRLDGNIIDLKNLTE